MAWSLSHVGTIRDLATGITWTRDDLNAQVARRRATLQSHGIAPSHLVAILHGNSAAFVADLLAVWSCGAAALVLDPALTEGELAHLIDFAKPALALGGRDGRMAAGGATVCLDGTGPGLHGKAQAPMAIDPDSLALVLVTSGTTGSPKAVALSHRALQNRLRHNHQSIGTAPLARALVTLSTSFGHGLIGNLLTPLFAGGDIVFPPRSATLARDLGPLIDEHGISFVTGVPSLWRMALKMSSPPQRRSLHRVHVGSAPLSDALWRDIVSWSGAETVNCYGLTEVANWFAGASSADTAPRSGLIGRPWGGRAAVLTASGDIAAEGEGELLIDSPSLMAGYLHRPDLTEPCLIGTSRTGTWYRTGDAAVIEPDGRIVLQGRLKDEINRAGSKIQPAEIDLLLESHPDVEEACTFACPDPVSGEVAGIAVVLKPGATTTTADLAMWCRQRIRRALAPERWYIVAALPRTPRGKMRRDEVYRAVMKETA